MTNQTLKIEEQKETKGRNVGRNRVKVINTSCTVAQAGLDISL